MNKYARVIRSCEDPTKTLTVDIYSVLAAFPTGSATIDHAVKKCLAPGQRGSKDRLTDLREAVESIQRAIRDEEAVG